MNITLVDTLNAWSSMLPLTYDSPISSLRVGILTLNEKWKRYIPNVHLTFRTQLYLSKKYKSPQSKNLTIDSRIIPNVSLLKKISNLKTGEVLIYNDMPIAGYYEPDEPFEVGTRKTTTITARLLKYPRDIFLLNGDEIRNDFLLLNNGKNYLKNNAKNTTTYGSTNIFVARGASIKSAILNAENGPIYIGKDAEVQEGSMIRGPFALCDNAVVHMGTKIKGDSTIGPFSRVGGEISNSVIQGYSNKAHGGFLGNSVIGKWCNLGADTNVSNLKNNYSSIKVWDYCDTMFINTQLQFCGLVMGNHSKAGINTMFNAGSSVGFSCNIFDSNFPDKFIPSFTWGGAKKFTTYNLQKALETAKKTMERRNLVLTPVEEAIFLQIFESTEQYRDF